MARTVQLDDASAAMAERLVADGRFESVDAVVAAAVRELRRSQAEQDFLAALARSEDDIKAGRLVDADTVLAEYRRRFGPAPERR